MGQPQHVGAALPLGSVWEPVWTDGFSAVGLTESATSRLPLIEHDSWRFRIWHGFIIICILLMLAIIPLRLAFFQHSAVVETLTTVTDAAYGLDILVQMRLTFTDHMTGEKVKDARRIAMRYSTRTFVPDVLSVIPMERVFKRKKLAFLCFIRFIRVIRLQKFVAHLERSEHVDYHLVKLTNLTVLLVFWGHLSGCVMWWLARLSDFDANTTWVGHGGFDPDVGVVKRFVVVEVVVVVAAAACERIAVAVAVVVGTS